MTAVLEHMELGFPWTCLDPFLFTVHHLDRYPEGLEHQGPSPD
ncbi:MAG: pirin family protein, partial [Acidimicrobiia bacterium]|nr:pirin family protein [Acidimicrobiia bacterium]NNL14224.1 pirin family protein [Acidimicrobiia bacterium]